MDEELRAFWEPGAPSFAERLSCLRLAYEAGFTTSVSAEPLLEPWGVEELVKTVRPYVTDAVWLGKLNHLRMRTRGLVSPADPHLTQLETWQTDEKVRAIFEMFRNDPVIRYKDSYKEIIGLDLPTEAG